jgi:predicted esterase
MSSATIKADLSIKAEINLYYDLYAPDNIRKPAPLLIAVHGYGAHKRYMMREARAIAPDGFVIASLQGPYQHFRPTPEGYRVGFGWLTDHRSDESVELHHKFVNELLNKLEKEAVIDRSAVHLLGFSQACSLNFRYAFSFPEAIRSVTGICGGIPSDLDTNAKYKPFNAETFYLYGDNDEFYSEERFDEFDKKLGEILPNYRSKRYAAKHEITDQMRLDVKDFLCEVASV